MKLLSEISGLKLLQYNLLVFIPGLALIYIYSSILPRFPDRKFKFSNKTGQHFLRCLNYIMIAEDLRLPLSEEYSLKNLPDYKFYTKIVLKVVVQLRQLGIASYEVLKSLKKGIILDQQFERKLSSELHASFLQFILTALLTYSFVFSCKKILTFPAVTQTILWGGWVGLIAIHLIGILCFLFSYYWLKRRIFAPFTEYLEVLYGLKILERAKIPIAQILQQLPIHKVINSTAKIAILAPLNFRVQQLLELAQKLGVPLHDQIDEIIEEMWFSIEQKQELFRRILSGIRFIYLIIFYVFPYFFLIFRLFSNALK